MFKKFNSLGKRIYDSLTVVDSAFSSSWNGDNTVPTKNAVYDVVKDSEKSYAQSFLLMGG